MSKYSELAEILEAAKDEPLLDVGWRNACLHAAVALRELEAERDRLWEALHQIADIGGGGVASEEARIARAALEGK
jgi:hypothetical protein